MLDTIAEKFGRLDVLVANAGINPVYGPLVDMELDAARKIFDVNVLGTLAWVQDAVHHNGLNFRENRGRVVAISSVAGQVPSEGIGFYGISKAAVSHLTKTLAVELGPDIRVNAVAPAVVKTKFATALYEGREEEVASAYPVKRLGTPEDIAGAVAYLASEDADWITAQVLTADGVSSPPVAAPETEAEPAAERRLPVAGSPNLGRHRTSAPESRSPSDTSLDGK